MIPLVDSSDDLPDAIRYADTRPGARWYVAQRANALGLIASIPEEWGLTAAAEPSQAERDALAAKGHALPDGSFPIRNKADIQNAIHAMGRAGGDLPKGKKKGAVHRVKRHIVKRARALNAMDALPESWGITAAGAFRRGERAVGGLWNEALHPRGRDGKWIENGGSVNVFDSQSAEKPSLRGTAVGVKSAAGGKTVLSVKLDHPGFGPDGRQHAAGEVIDVSSDNISSAPAVKAHLNAPDPNVLHDIASQDPMQPGHVPEGAPTSLVSDPKAQAEDLIDAGPTDKAVDDTGTITLDDIANVNKSLISDNDLNTLSNQSDWSPGGPNPTNDRDYALAILSEADGYQRSNVEDAEDDEGASIDGEPDVNLDAYMRSIGAALKADDNKTAGDHAERLANYLALDYGADDDMGDGPGLPERPGSGDSAVDTQPDAAAGPFGDWNATPEQKTLAGDLSSQLQGLGLPEHDSNEAASSYVDTLSPDELPTKDEPGTLDQALAQYVAGVDPEDKAALEHLATDVVDPEQFPEAHKVLESDLDLLHGANTPAYNNDAFVPDPSDAQSLVDALDHKDYQTAAQIAGKLGLNEERLTTFYGKMSPDELSKLRAARESQAIAPVTQSEPGPGTNPADTAANNGSTFSPATADSVHRVTQYNGFGHEHDEIGQVHQYGDTFHGYDQQGGHLGEFPTHEAANQAVSDRANAVPASDQAGFDAVNQMQTSRRIQNIQQSTSPAELRHEATSADPAVSQAANARLRELAPDESAARFDAADKAVKDSFAAGNHLSDDPGMVAQHNGLEDARNRAFDATPAGKELAARQQANADATHVASEAERRAKVPGQLADQADRRDTNAAAEATPDEKIARMSDTGLRMVANGQSQHAAAAQAELDRRNSPAADDIASRVGVSPESAQQYPDAVQNLNKAGMKIGDPVKLSLTSIVNGKPEGSAEQPGDYQVVGLARNGNVVIRDVKSNTTTHANQSDLRKTEGSLSPSQQAASDEIKNRAAGMSAEDAATRRQEQSGGGRAIREAEREADRNVATGGVAQALRDRAKPRYQVRTSDSPDGEVRHHVVDTHNDNARVRSFKGKPNASKHANDLNRGDTAKQQAAVVSGKKVAANREDLQRRLSEVGLTPSQAPGSMDDVNKHDLPGMTTTELEKLASEGGPQAATARSIAETRRRNSPNAQQAALRAKVKGLDENGNAKRPISTSIASNQLRVAGHKSAGGEGGGSGFKVKSDGAGGVDVTFNHGTDAEQAAAVDSAQTKFEAMGYNVTKNDNGSLTISNRTASAQDTSATPAMDALQRAVRTNPTSSDAELRRAAGDSYMEQQRVKAAELTAAHPGYTVTTGPLGGLNIAGPGGKDKGTIVRNHRTGKYDIQRDVGNHSMDHATPEDAMKSLEQAGTPRRAMEARAESGKKTHIPGVTLHGSPTDPIGAEVRKDGQKIGRLEDHRDATIDVMGRGSSARLRVGSKKDPHYAYQSIHRGQFLGNRPIRGRKRTAKEALDELHQIHTEKSTAEAVNLQTGPTHEQTAKLAAGLTDKELLREAAKSSNPMAREIAREELNRRGVGNPGKAPAADEAATAEQALVSKMMHGSEIRPGDLVQGERVTDIKKFESGRRRLEFANGNSMSVLPGKRVKVFRAGETNTPTPTPSVDRPSGTADNRQTALRIKPGDRLKVSIFNGQALPTRRTSATPVTVVSNQAVVKNNRTRREIVVRDAAGNEYTMDASPSQTHLLNLDTRSDAKKTQDAQLTKKYVDTFGDDRSKWPTDRLHSAATAHDLAAERELDTRGSMSHAEVTARMLGKA